MSESIINLVKHLARMSLPEDEVNTAGLDEAAAEEKIEEYICDFSDDRLFGEYSAFMEMVRSAREVLAELGCDMTAPNTDEVL